MLQELLEDIRARSYRISPEEIEFDRGQPIGDGGFGKVYRCTYRCATYALKVLSFAEGDTARRKLLQDFATDEVHAMLELHSTEHVSTLVGICHPASADELWLMFDMINGKTLHQAFVEIWKHRRTIESQMRGSRCLP